MLTFLQLRAEQKAAAAKASGTGDGKLMTFDFLTLGCISGAVAQTAAYPFDLMRKRFMAQSNAPGMLKTQYTSVFGCAKEIVEKEGERRFRFSSLVLTNFRFQGFLGLYKGTVPNLLKVCPYAAIMWAGMCFGSGILLTIVFEQVMRTAARASSG